ncbi:hypothetical protein AURDEDRAFT_163762 [Auricularia subglabra TFB-10046 SS5]|nr:hypothetical protein AURDEDRAFT_163762 [Auricularia subglabra TFB-10046 SS5]
MRVGLVLELAWFTQPLATMYSRLQLAKKHLYLILGGSLPFLVSLSVAVPNALGPALHALLCQPAPHLRNLRIALVDPYGLERSHIHISSKLLGGCSAKLRSVTLDGASLDPEPVPAFRHVQHVHISFTNTWPKITLKHHFPLESQLHITYMRSEPLPDFGLQGLVLESLTIEHRPSVPLTTHVEATIPLRMIPVVRQHTFFMRYEEPIWRDDTANLANLSVYLRTPDDSEEDISSTLLISKPDTRWRRIFDLRHDSEHHDPEHRAACPIMAMPGVQSSVTYLRIENRYLSPFLRNKAALNALRRLRVDLCLGTGCSTTIWSLDWCGNPFIHGSTSGAVESLGHVRISCPVLDELTIFAMYEAPGVRPDEAAYLARALGQLERPHEERARLVLVGVQFAAAAFGAQSLADKAFSAVQLRPFAGRHSAEDYEGGLWTY